MDSGVLSGVSPVGKMASPEPQTKVALKLSVDSPQHFLLLRTRFALSNEGNKAECVSVFTSSFLHIDVGQKQN